MKKAAVLAVSKSEKHTFIKYTCAQINLLKGLGVEGDAHMGKKVKHVYLVRKNPNQPNLRQVHLMHSELFDELEAAGFKRILPGEMGENITTIGLDLLNLPKNTILAIGKDVKIQITGLRDPCNQLNDIQEGLLKALIYKDKEGNLIRKTGIMGIVLEGGIVQNQDKIAVQLPEKPFVALEPV